MFYIYIQTMHKHGAWSHSYYLKTEAPDWESALYCAESWVIERMPFGVTIVEDATLVETTLPAFDLEDMAFTLIELKGE